MLTALAFLVGTWNCAYSTGGQTSPYTATYAYVMNGNWLRERDVWSGGSVDNLFTYDANRNVFRVAVIKSDRTLQIFEAPASGEDKSYRSVYPDDSASWSFERLSATHFKQHFEQSGNLAVIRFSDDCRKAGS